MVPRAPVSGFSHGALALAFCSRSTAVAALAAATSVLENTPVLLRPPIEPVVSLSSRLKNDPSWLGMLHAATHSSIATIAAGLRQASRRQAVMPAGPRHRRDLTHAL